MADYTLSSCAFSKMLLHTAKYPHCSVNGILLAQKSNEKESKKVELVDCVPLFHLNLSLAPMMEVALTQVDTYCSARDLVIAGYYQANEHVSDSQPNTICAKITERIQENYKQACMVMLDNELITSECSTQCVQMYTLQDGHWKKSDRLQVEELAESTAAFLMHTKVYQSLVDFDNHLDDVSLEWTNTHISQLIHVSS